MLDLEHDWDGVPTDGLTVTYTRELIEVDADWMIQRYHPGRARFVIEGDASLVRRVSAAAMPELVTISEEVGP